MDWRVIQSIAHATWPDTYGRLLPIRQLEYMLDLISSEQSLKHQMERNQQFFIGYLANDSSVGFASVEEHYKSAGDLMIHKLYLLSEFHGKGIGKAFIDYISGLATQTEHDTLILKVFFKNQEAIRFYERLGFRSIGEEMTELGNGYSVLDYIMIKKDVA
ncbi:MAG: GNAT family N-acetyltransferase [Cyclobacteriaceae bacterium]|nr:GNAT family N-acetyltransferase [Cyclobacteriaceae bacterium]